MSRRRIPMSDDDIVHPSQGDVETVKFDQEEDEAEEVEEKSKKLRPKDIDQIADDDDKKKKMPPAGGTDLTEESLFFSIFEKDRVIINKAEAGAGFVGLLGFGALFLIASIFFIIENYFISMFTISIGLLVYVTGLNVVKLLQSSFTIFFSSKHLNANAASLQETLLHLKKVLRLKRNKEGEIVAGPVIPKQPIPLPDNPLTRDLKKIVESNQGFDYAEYIGHTYYLGCHELYDSSSSNFDFVSNAMPLFGLIGTIVGLIGMFDSLGADVTVESLTPQLALALKTTLYGAIFSSIYKIIGTRFEQRLKILDYDFESFCRALQVVIKNENTIEVH